MQLIYINLKEIVGIKLQRKVVGWEETLNSKTLQVLKGKNKDTAWIFPREMTWTSIHSVRQVQIIKVININVCLRVVRVCCDLTSTCNNLCRWSNVTSPDQRQFSILFSNHTDAFACICIHSFLYSFIHLSFIQKRGFIEWWHTSNFNKCIPVGASSGCSPRETLPTEVRAPFLHLCNFSSDSLQSIKAIYQCSWLQVHFRRNWIILSNAKWKRTLLRVPSRGFHWN